MNGSKLVTGSVKPGSTRIIKVAPVTRAIRAALAISVTAMVLGGSGAAFAGTCTPPSSNTIYCDGSFLDTITFPDVDLTLIVGGNAPTSVTPGFGAVGIEGNWPGNVNITNYGDITTSGADGIHAYGSSSAQVVNRGNITATASAVPPPLAGDADASAFIVTPGAIAIDAVAYGNVTVTNSGYASAIGTGVYDVTAVLAESTGVGYTATVYNQSAGSILAFTDGSGTALGIEGYAARGDVDITNNGLLVAVSYYGIADGAFAAGQNVDVSNGGYIYGIGGSWGAGIEAQGDDLTRVSNSGTIYAAASAAYGHGFGVYATSGAGGTTVYNRGTINVLGPYATGIEAQSDGGAVDVRNVYGANIVAGNSFTSYLATGIDASTSSDASDIFVYNGGGITALSHYGSTGISAVATGAGSTVNVINSGSLYVNTAGLYNSTGIVASGDGITQVYNRGAVTVAFGGASYGVMALSFNDLAIVNNTGKVDVTAVNYIGEGHGLVASSANGAARAYNSGTVTVNAGYYGFGMEAGGMTGARVRNSGTIAVDAKYGYGIVATSGQGYVNVYNDAAGTVSVNSDYGSAFGIIGVANQDYVSIGNGGSVSATSLYQAIGILARSNAGNVSVGNNGSLSATSYLGPAIGLVAIASGGNAYATGNGTSDIQVYSSGNTAIGIEAQADDGSARVYNLGDIAATAGQDPTAMTYTGALGVADGIFATGQSVRVVDSGNITATGYGWAAGIEAQGSDWVNVGIGGGSINATSTGAYSHSFGVYAIGGAGGVSIYNNGAITALGSYATGIQAQVQAPGGGINISNAGDIIAGTTGRTYYATGIAASTNYAGSNIYVHNAGSVSAFSRFGSDGIAVAATGAGSTATVVNAGDVYAITSSKYYAATGIAASADGNALISNGGTITVAYGGASYGAVALAFNGNANVINSGDIDVTGGLVIGYGTGILSSSQNGNAGVGNSGSVTVNADYLAVGIQANGLTGTTVSNYGSVDVQAKYYGYGIMATSGQGDVLVRNVGGSVDVQATNGIALGISAISTLGNATIYNSGTVTVAADFDAIGLFARASAGDVTVINTDDVTVTSAFGPATGLLAHATGGFASVFNNADVSAVSTSSDAIGIEAISDDSGVVVNSTNGSITATGGYGYGTGLADGIFAAGDTVYVRSGGGIYATGYAWAAGIEAQGEGLTRVYNTGVISATSTGDYSHAFGMYVTSGAGGITAYNGGDITAQGPYATGIQAQSGSGVIAVDNRGDITVGDLYATYLATGINAATSDAGGNIVIGNSGSITTNSYYGSTGISAIATGAGSTGYVANSGRVYANTYLKYTSSGIVVSADGDARIHNTSTGSITVAYGGNSYGEVALSFNGNASVQNEGDVDVTGGAFIVGGYGIISNSANGAASVTNSGSVTVYGGYAATGIQVGSMTGTSVGNSGTLDIDTFKYGYGILATSGRGDVSIYNSAAGVVDVYSYAISALGITGIATLGNVSIYNNGTVSASGYTDTIGIFARANAGNTSVTSSGDISAFTYISPAIGILSRADAGNASATNIGSITATSQGDYAFGIEGRADNGTVSIGNSGDITVAGGADLYAVQYTGSLGLADGIFGLGAIVRVNNNGGSIDATGYGWAAGIEVNSSDLASVYSSGSITATSVGDDSYAFGIYAAAGAGGLTVRNYGGMTVVGPYATGIQAQSSGAINIGNSGDIVVGDAFASHYAIGINATSSNAGSGIFIRNDGGVTVNSYYGSTGIAAVANGDATVVNSGDIYVNSTALYTPVSTGIFVAANNANIYSTGSVTVAYGGASSVGAYALATYDASITNQGDVDVTCARAVGLQSVGFGFGLVALSVYGAANVNNGGGVSVYANDLAMGIHADGYFGATVSNSGAVAVDANRGAYGILATSDQGDVVVGNSAGGSVDVYSNFSTAFGIAGIATLGDVSIYNAGTVSASGFFADNIGIFARALDGNVAVNSVGDVSAYTHISPAIGILAHATGGYATVYNDGSISAISGGDAAIGIEGQSDTGAVSISNSGDITAIGDANPADTAYTGALGLANAILALGKTVNASNSGDIVANGYAIAQGINAQSADQTTVENSGTINATTTRAYAATYGALAQSGGGVYVGNSGSITAVSDGANSDVTGVLAQSYGTVTVNNSGDISAVSNGADSNTIGLRAVANGVVSVTNSGTITATDPLYAVAVSLNSGAYSILRNTSTGAITTNAPLEGNIAVLGGNGFENILNYGYIHGAIVTNGGIDQLFNGNGGLWLVDNHSTDFGDGDDIVGNAAGGTIQLTDAAITLGLGNDTFGNGGLVQATGSTIELGDGNDTVNSAAGGTIQLIDSAIETGDGNDVINNTGTIALTDSAIRLGDGDDSINNASTIQLTDSGIYFEGGAGNSFSNTGLIHVFGDSLIDMGSGGTPPEEAFAPTAVPSLNAIPLVNNGVISFLDGAPDDVLTIVGDLGGNGNLNIDVSLLNGTSDMLYVDGSIVTGSVQTVNVALDQLPTTAITSIPFAHVTGNSVDGAFVFGGFAAGSVINIDPSNFLDLQLGVVSQIDPTNATDDVFSIGLEVAGLNDAGTLAANVAPGVQSLVNSQIGTWRQRMGVIPEKREGDAGLGLWLRVFNDQGEVDPAHVSANFAQNGGLRFDQSNSGQEVGMNVNPTGGFNFGLLLGKSEGSQHLIGPRVGSDRISADTAGLYGTWISPKGYYVDASYRWIDFDAVLRSAGGEQLTKGYAGAWNLEAGYDAWTLSNGMKITPQIQYTHTHVSEIDALHGDLATFDARGGDSSRARLGVAVSKSIRTGSDFIWTPYGSLNAIREFDGETSYAINNAFFGATSTEGTSAMVELGIGMQKGGLSVTGGFNWTDGGALQSFTGGQLSLRYTW